MNNSIDQEYKHYPRVLSIAGSDSGAGAGIQADIKAISACGAYAMTAITAITAQNTLGVVGIHPIPIETVGMQIAAVCEDIGVDAVKIGMLHSIEIIEKVAELLRQYQPDYIVLDPVMIATSGASLFQQEAVGSLVELLIPLATLITPNIPEAEALTGISIESEEDYDLAAERILKMGAQAVLLKGGHQSSDILTDRLYIAGQRYDFSNPRIDTPNTHGTGCSLSSAIAAFLAQGLDVASAVEHGIAYVHLAISSGAAYEMGRGHGPINHFF